DMPLPVRLNSLWHAWLSGGWWKWITVPLSTWLMTMAHLKQLFGSMTVMVQIVIAAFMLLAHGWFWWRALKRPANRVSFCAVVLMLVFYVACAGIIFVRIAAFGNDYLNQPRYALHYSLGVVALLLMVSSAITPRPITRIRALRMIGVTLAVAFIGLQFLISVYTWRTLPYLSNIYQNEAAMMGEMWRHPSET